MTLELKRTLAHDCGCKACTISRADSLLSDGALQLNKLALADSGFEEIATEDSCSEEDEMEPKETSQVTIPTFSTPFFSTFTMAPNSDRERRRPRLLTATIRRLDDNMDSMDKFR